MNPLATRSQLPKLPYPTPLQVVRQINAHRTPAGGGGSTLLTGLLHWWDLNESSGDAIDATGTQDLTEGGTIGVATGGAPDGGNARDFPGSVGAHFSASAGSIWNSGTTMSFSFWFRRDNVTGNLAAYGHNAPNGANYHLWVGANDVNTFYFDAVASMTGHVLNKEQWYHIVVTSTGPGGSDELFIDGTSANTGTAGWEPGSATFYLGAYFNGGLTFNGRMCSAAIWNRVISSTEVTELYNSGTNLRYADL